MTTQSVKITKKGQVTIPKEIRDDATVVFFEVVEGDIVLRAVRDAGALSKYAANAKPGVAMKQMKDKAWTKAVHEKADKKPARYEYSQVDLHTRREAE